MYRSAFYICEVPPKYAHKWQDSLHSFTISTLCCFTWVMALKHAIANRLPWWSLEVLLHITRILMHTHCSSSTCGLKCRWDSSPCLKVSEDFSQAKTFQMKREASSLQKKHPCIYRMWMHSQNFLTHVVPWYTLAWDLLGDVTTGWCKE